MRIYIFFCSILVSKHISRIRYRFFFHAKIRPLEKLQSNDENVRMNVTLFIHKKYFYIENFNANSHLELCTHHGSFEKRQMMADTVDTCMLCEVFMFMFNGGYFSGFILAHISFTAHATRLSVPTLFFHRIFLVLNVMSFLFLTSPIVILCLQRDSYSLSFLTFFACSKSYFDKSIILLCLCLIGSNEMYEVVRWLN